MRHKVSLLVVALALLTAPVLTADTVITRGIDAFTTPADGSTFVSFANNPLPAGFFCEGSAPFTGTVALKGKAIATDSKKLPAFDTVVERLDDAAFNEQGVALTRVRLSALSLVGTAPVQTSCGKYRVVAGLNGQQRETVMRITRENELGGTYVSPLAVDTKVIFVPIQGNTSPRRTVSVSINFPSHAPTPWALARAPEGALQRPFLIDTNGDGHPETSVNGSGNFLPGVRHTGSGIRAGAGGTYICHDSGTGEEHCYWSSCGGDYICLEP
ncbi:MAG TPA: hypothetical protein VF017_14835 [Thermoanaerobaculia bacterium]|nr:hypothetical protein [Thermoanaerobaculia bacterium]